ncbi:hypothetical protein M431DRAFT_102563, partial [Trichoderma harzianum CBS 226.95]
NIKINRLSDKLDFKKLRPYKITKKIRPVNYKIDLLLTLRKRGKTIYLNFYILLLEKALVDKEIGKVIRDKIVI